MITHHGFRDGSGEYYVSVDSDKCDGCGKCVPACPQSALEVLQTMVDIEEKMLACVKETHRKKLNYTCAACAKSERFPCGETCPAGAIEVTWKTSK